MSWQVRVENRIPFYVMLNAPSILGRKKTEAAVYMSFAISSLKRPAPLEAFANVLV